MPLVPVGGRCQKDRDDECQGPPNYAQLRGFLNWNGSICLNYTCLCVCIPLRIALPPAEG